MYNLFATHFFTLTVVAKQNANNWILFNVFTHLQMSSAFKKKLSHNKKLSLNCVHFEREDASLAEDACPCAPLIGYI